MKQLLSIAFLLLCGTAAHAQDIVVADLFKQMPDSLFPYLSQVNRLDMLDFLDAGMKAEVTNTFDEKTEMTFISADSLSVQMNEVLRVDMKMLPVAESVDSSLTVIRLTRTYTLNEKQAERVVDVYSSAWRRLSSHREQSSLLLRDEELLEKPHFW